MSLDKERVEYSAKTTRSRAMHEEAVADSPMAHAITEYMATREVFCGTASELLKALVKAMGDGSGGKHLARGLPRSEGHRRGVEALRRTVRAAGELGIRILTIFSFSSENWLRPPAEVRELMVLLRRFIRNDLAELHKNDVRVRVIGERGGVLVQLVL